jgi:hypothetical protein
MTTAAQRALPKVCRICRQLRVASDTYRIPIPNVTKEMIHYNSLSAEKNKAPPMDNHRSGQQIFSGQPDVTR